jgi:hypothetical protein
MIAIRLDIVLRERLLTLSTGRRRIAAGRPRPERTPVDLVN